MRRIDIALPAARDARVACGAQRARKPRLVVEPDAHQEIGVAKARDLRGLHVHRVGIGKGRRQVFHGDAISPDRFDERRKVRRRGDHAQRRAARRR
jgi:hypothetical protein